MATKYAVPKNTEVIKRVKAKISLALENADKIPDHKKLLVSRQISSHISLNEHNKYESTWQCDEKHLPCGQCVITESNKTFREIILICIDTTLTEFNRETPP